MFIINLYATNCRRIVCLCRLLCRCFSRCFRRCLTGGFGWCLTGRLGRCACWLRRRLRCRLGSRMQSRFTNRDQRYRNAATGMFGCGNDIVIVTSSSLSPPFFFDLDVGKLLLVVFKCTNISFEFLRCPGAVCPGQGGIEFKRDILSPACSFQF